MPTRERTPVVSTWLLKPVVAALRSRGLRLSPLLHAAGLSALEIDVPTGKLPRSAAVRLLEAAAIATGEPAFALDAASFYQPGANVFDYAGVTSPTVGAALHRVSRYARLVDEGLQLKLELSGHLAKMVVSGWDDRPLPPVFAEYTIAIGVTAARQWVGFAFPLEVHFCHPRPLDTAAHERVLSSSLSFQQEANAIVFPREALAIPLRAADADLLPALDAQASKLLATSLSQALPLEERVLELLRGELEMGCPTTELIAKRLKLSERTLRRRLAARQTSLKQLLDSADSHNKPGGEWPRRPS